jgi:hypothetical protein
MHGDNVHEPIKYRITLGLPCFVETLRDVLAIGWMAPL